MRERGEVTGREGMCEYLHATHATQCMHACMCAYPVVLEAVWLLQDSQLALETRQPAEARDKVRLVLTAGRVAVEEAPRPYELLLNRAELTRRRGEACALLLLVTNGRLLALRLLEPLALALECQLLLAERAVADRVVKQAAVEGRGARTVVPLRLVGATGRLAGRCWRFGAAASCRRRRG